MPLTIQFFKEKLLSRSFSSKLSLKKQLKEQSSKILKSTRELQTQNQGSSENFKSLLWASCRTICASSVRILTLEEWRIVIKRIKTMPTLRRKNSFVASVPLSQSEEAPSNARNMAKSSSNTSVSSVAACHSGSAGETLISASHVTRSNAAEIMYLARKKKNCPNAQDQKSVHWRSSIQLTEKNMLWVVVCARIWLPTKKASDHEGKYKWRPLWIRKLDDYTKQFLFNLSK